MTKYLQETEDNPKMLQVFLKEAYHEVLCYGLASLEGNKGQGEKLLFTIISGSDSALQSIKASIDIGSRGISFGNGEKTNTNYLFKREKYLFSEKGKYEMYPMTLSRTRKALAIVHESILNNSGYVLSIGGNPANDIAQLLGGSQFGLHILPEWKETVLHELIQSKHLIKHEIYYDGELFQEGVDLFSLDLTEEAADQFIERLLIEKKIVFPRQGDGKKVEETEELTTYLLNYNEAMVKKLSESVTPTHNPLEHNSLEHFSSFPRELFPVQGHSSTAVVKRLKEQKAVIIQGEMSTGKSAMMTAISEGYHHSIGMRGYHVCLMCPPSLTSKWPSEIREILPHAKIFVIDKADKLIAYHREWVAKGRQKPLVPTFFVISFTAMRGDSKIAPAVKYQHKVTAIQKAANSSYKKGIYCSNCGKPHQTIEAVISRINADGFEVEEKLTHNMTAEEFGESRRIQNGVKPANAFCSHCGDSLWTRRVPQRFSSFKEWTAHEKRISHAIKQKNPKLYKQIQSELPEHPKATGLPRRIATIEYIRRKMKGWFHMAIVDEVHELKSGNTAQGNALGSLVGASKKVVAGTGTLFGGKAEDIYYLLWRLFPQMMVESGYKYQEVTRFNHEFGNIEETIYTSKGEAIEQTNTHSRGGDNRRTQKVVPGISPFIFGKYMIQNIINVRLKDVWPDPVELVNTPTIFVPMSPELKEAYEEMIYCFEEAIDTREDGQMLYLPMTDYGIAYPDNPFTFPDAYYKMTNGVRELIWSAKHLSEDITLPKEAKLQEIITGEMEERRKSIVYVRDTGSSVAGRDIRPRIKQKLEEIGAKVCILDTSSTKTNSRSEWLKKKIEDEDYDVCIVSQELVKTGLDLLCTPTLIYYQFSWSLFTINQSSRRAWRIGQTEECRLFYLAYEDSFQQYMAEIIAKKNKATAAINGEISSDGLSAMLGDDGDLQSMLIQSVKQGGSALRGSAEDWIAQSSDRARELLAGIGKKKKPSLLKQFEDWITREIKEGVTKQCMLERIEVLADNIEQKLIPGFVWNGKTLKIDIVEAFGFERDIVSDGAILRHLCLPQTNLNKQSKLAKETNSEIESSTPIISISLDKAREKKKKKTAVSDGQLAFDLFG
ncbi:DEAD/DEAH box helicase [Psychrobacillus sp. MER TA 171]|uniref:DEAD/DEAH box helicase n=1 Tax=Psychrobacillus sp. MER TA 171 TaxID=2939577 RepID=UPI00203B56CA|nr:DEAD/DEAH box helicase [Psychrobacillus sp. MER TA 171]MCM3358108.1 DEAD/DEAH box helicase [Psychrobacillus sp. MER TA 171]